MKVLSRKAGVESRKSEVESRRMSIRIVLAAVVLVLAQGCGSGETRKCEGPLWPPSGRSGVSSLEEIEEEYLMSQVLFFAARQCVLEGEGEAARTLFKRASSMKRSKTEAEAVDKKYAAWRANIL